MTSLLMRLAPVVRFSLACLLLAMLTIALRPAPGFAQAGFVGATEVPPEPPQESAGVATTATPAEQTANPAPQDPGPKPNLAWQKFPAEFADYYTTQRVLANPVEPQPFCKSSKPLRIDHHPTYNMNAVLDESGGTGTGYDTLYIDMDGDGDFTNDPVYKISPQDRKTGLEGHPLVSYFDNVNIPRGPDSVSEGGSAHVQMFLEQNPDRIEGSEYLLNMIPAQWAIGTIQVNGQATPVAMVDGTFNDSAVNRHGMRPNCLNNMSPGEDSGVVRSDFLIIGKPGEAALQPGDPNSWLGKTGSARSMNTQYLVTDSGIFEIQASQTDQGVDLQLVPSNVPTASVDIAQYPHNGTRLAMFGTNACVLLDNPGSYVQVPGDTYYLPAFGAFTFNAPAGGPVTLFAPEGFDSLGPQGFDSLADRDQMLFATEPPGGELGTTNAVHWAQPRNNPFGFALRPNWPTIEVQVLATTNEPIPRAAINVSSYAGGFSGRWSGGSRRCTSDANGHCTIQVPPAAQYVTATIDAPGYVPTCVSWRSGPNQPLPTQYTWVLERGTTIGGVVHEERGRPIAGVSVMIRVLPGALRPGGGFPTLDRLRILTDKRGKWHCDAAPADLSRVQIGLSHPQYISDQQPSRSVAVNELRSQTCDLVMKEGIVLAGKVVNHKNKPVENATINYGNYSVVKTDRQGRYRIGKLTPRRLNVTVHAPGCAPEQKTITVEENMHPVDFKLEPGNLLKSRIVDPYGNPIPSAQVFLQSWRGARGIFWFTRTDAQGRWTWPDAPADEAVFRITAEGYMPLEDLRLAADRDELIITLRSQVMVTGLVTDAATGQPVASFTATPGTEYGIPGFYRWQDQAKATGTNGQFSLQIAQQSRQYVVRIDAPGYLSGVSKGFRSADGDRTIDIALKRDNAARTTDPQAATGAGGR